MKNIYLSNVLCGDVYPDNKPGEFTNYLNQTLKPDGSWSVALNEMYYIPHTWHNIRFPGNVISMKIEGKQFNMRRERPNPWSGTYEEHIQFQEPEWFFVHGIAEIEAHIPIGNYIDIFNLLEKVVHGINIALYEHFHAAKDDKTIYKHNIGRG